MFAAGHTNRAINGMLGVLGPFERVSPHQYPESNERQMFSFTC
jgi:hypothetical protein